MIPYTNIHRVHRHLLFPFGIRQRIASGPLFRRYSSVGCDGGMPPAPRAAAATETMRSGGRRRNRTRPCFRPEERIMSDNSPDCPTAKRFGAPSSGHYPLCQSFRITDGTFGRILAARRHFPWLYRQSAADRKAFRRRILPLGRTDIAAVAQNGSIAPGSASPSSFHRNRRQRRPDRADVHCRRRPPQYTRT